MKKTPALFKKENGGKWGQAPFLYKVGLINQAPTFFKTCRLFSEKEHDLGSLFLQTWLFPSGRQVE